MQKYEILEQIGEGTYGVVLKCRNRETGEIVAVKRFKDPTNPTDAQYLKITTREVQTLKLACHPFVVSVLEAFRRKQKTFLVFEYCESTVLQLIEQHLLDQHTIKLISLQILFALRHLHELSMVHRDVKPENLLLQFKAASELGLAYKRILPLLKLCDFGFARKATCNGVMTEYVSTRWYRAPELLVSDEYSFQVDMWAFGLVLCEMVTGDPLLPGDTDIDMLYRIYTGIGELTAAYRARFSAQPKHQGQKLYQYKMDIVASRMRGHEHSLIKLIKDCLAVDPGQRISAEDAIASVFYDDVRDDVERIMRKLRGRDCSADSIEQLCLEADEQIARSKSQLSMAQKTPIARSHSNIRQQNYVLDLQVEKPARYVETPRSRNIATRFQQQVSPYLPQSGRRQSPAFKAPQTQTRPENMIACYQLYARIAKTQGVNLPGIRRK